MARQLGDVLHFFLDDAPAPKPAEVPVLAVALGSRDVLRAAFAWNLAEELARGGVETTVVTPAIPVADAIWPEPGARDGARRRLATGDGPEALGRAVREASRRDAGAPAGLVMVPAPQDALAAGAPPPWLRWLLLFATPDPREHAATAGWLRRLPGEAAGLRVGVTIHGVNRIDEARRAFHDLAELAEREGGRRLWSYGLLVDDLDVYRAIAERSLVGDIRPLSRAARAIRDVAAWIRADLSPPAHA